MSQTESRRIARLLDGVRQEIDGFLDPSVLVLADGAAGVPSSIRTDAAREETETMRKKWEDLQREHETLHLEFTQRASRDAAKLALLEKERERLEQEGREKRRRLDEVETKHLRLASESSVRARECDELKERSRLELENLTRQHSVERRKLQAEIQRMDLEARTPVHSNMSPGPETQRIAELERETASLRLIIEQGEPDRKYSAQLRNQHVKNEEELRSGREAVKQLQELRIKMLEMDQKHTTLHAALEARDKQLRDAEEVLCGATVAKRDLAAFVTTVSNTLAEMPGIFRADGERAGVSNPTPLDLSLAWARFKSEAAGFRREQADMQQRLEQADQRERHDASELRRLRGDLASAQVRVENQQLDLRRTKDENATLVARVSALREVMQHSTSTSTVDTVKATEETMIAESQLEAAKGRATDAETLAHSRGRELEQVREELEAAKQRVARLAEAEARSAKLERVNTELWQSNRQMEQRFDELTGPQNENGREVDSVKVLHVGRTPYGLPPIGSATSGASETGEEVRALRAELLQLRAGGTTCPVGAGDLEQQQGLRQLERFKKATKKYVQEFREGIYGLLGWKVEMREVASGMQWVLSSRYQEGGLIFQLRPGGPGQVAEFDLLHTPWAEQLQEDRQAMAYLEIYRSIPGFLSHLTTDLLTRQTLST